jgi:hypothetical protein
MDFGLSAGILAARPDRRAYRPLRFHSGFGDSRNFLATTSPPLLVWSWTGSSPVPPIKARTPRSMRVPGLPG